MGLLWPSSIHLHSRRCNGERSYLKEWQNLRHGAKLSAWLTLSPEQGNHGQHIGRVRECYPLRMPLFGEDVIVQATCSRVFIVATDAQYVADILGKQIGAGTANASKRTEQALCQDRQRELAGG